MFCRKCGNEIPDDSEFCFKCGAKIELMDKDNEERPKHETKAGTLTEPIELPAPEPSITLGKEPDKPASAQISVSSPAPNERPVYTSRNGFDDPPLNEAADVNRAEDTSPKKKSKKKALFISLGAAVAVFLAIFIPIEIKEQHREFKYDEFGDNAIIHGYLGEDEDIIIPDTIKNKPVTQISPDAFKGTDIKTVTIGKNVHLVGSDAFRDCKNLTSVSFLENGSETVHIEYYDFYNCTSLSKVEMPKSDTIITLRSFAKCTSLQSISLDNVSLITNGGSFMDSGLTSVDISDNTHLYGGIFVGCKELETVNLNNIKSIPGAMFYGCEKLKSVEWNGLSDGEIDIGYNAFRDCSSLSEITTYSDGEEKTLKCPDDIKKLNPSVKIGENAFTGCDKFKNPEPQPTEPTPGTTEPEKQFHEVAGANLVGKTQQEFMAYFNYEYEEVQEMGWPVFKFADGAISVPKTTWDYNDGITTSVLMGGNCYLSSGLGKTDFVHIGMSVAEVFDILGETEIKSEMDDFITYDLYGYHFSLGITYYSGRVPYVTSGSVSKSGR